jgi:hypothetical protein
VKESGLVLIGDVCIAEHTSTKRHVCSAVSEGEREREVQLAMLPGYVLGR